jgi:hypothetical protein
VQQVSPKPLRVITGRDRREGTMPAKPKVLDQIRDIMRTHDYSRSTKRSSCNWVKEFILSHARTTMVYTHALNRAGKGA